MNLPSKDGEANIKSVESPRSEDKRKRLPTQSGYNFTLGNKVGTFRKETNVLRRAIDDVYLHGEDKPNLEIALTKLQAVKKDYQKTLQDIENTLEQDRWGDSLETSTDIRKTGRAMIELADKAIAEAQRKENETAQRDEAAYVHSGRSKHTLSSRSRSSHSSTSSIRKREALADLAAAKQQAEFDVLIAEREKAMRQRMAEEERSRAALKAQHDHDVAVLKAKKRTAIAAAKLNVIEQSISEEEKPFRRPQQHDSSTSTKERTHKWINNQHWIEGQNSNETVSVRTSGCMKAIVNTNRQLTASLARQSLPKCHPDVFRGEVTMFNPWKNGFHAMIHDADISPEQELNYLHKYTSGEPQKLVDSFRKRQHTNLFKLVRDLWTELEQRFGNVAAITNALLEQLGETAKFSERDIKKLQEFSDLCANVDYQVGQLPGLECLNYPNAIRPLVMKLPTALRQKWEKQVVDFASENDEAYPSFHIFATMIKRHAKLKNHPNVTATANIINERERTRGQYQSKSNVNPDHRVLKGDVKMEDTIDGRKKYCKFHEREGHNLDECRVFLRKTLQDKTDWIKKAGLCFRCLAEKHIAKNCHAVVKCEKCSSDRHQTLLHLERINKNQDKEEVNSSCTELCDGTRGLSCSKIVLLDIFAQRKPDNVHRVYALIDEQSNASMISPDLADLIGAPGPKEKYFLSTCSASKETKFGRRVSGLMAVPVRANCKQMKLPTLIECNEIPNDKREIPTPELVKKFPHLREIAKDIPPFDAKADIHVLIGRDAPEIMKVRAFKNGPKGAPWAQKLLVGWTVSGQICLDRLGGPVHVSTHRTVWYDQTTSPTDTVHTRGPNGTSPTSIPPWHYVTSEFNPCPNKFEIKDVPKAKEDPNDIYHTTPYDDEAAMSIEDRRFLNIMDTSIHKNQEGNWETPLPFRSDNTILPNNRDVAVSRLNNLMRSFRRNPKMEKDYVNFMDKVLQRGHATPITYKSSDLTAESQADQGKVWYLPHFGVYHPRKPGCIRVVFDSSVEFKGVSLNKELLPGPDSTNSLYGILVRFRLHNIAVTCDIEHMFHCFYVNPLHRSMLRFLWFKDNDPRKEIAEFQMSVHLFGNTCSPAIATYGLRKTAEDGEERFGKAAKEFVRNDFYVDDGITSRESEEEVITLMKNTQAMLATANLRLHKFVSNSVAVMEALPPKDRLENLQDLDLHVDPLPIQRSLGLYWDLERDVFTFQVSPPEKPFTRRGVLATINSTYDPLGFTTPVTLGGRLLLRKLVDMGNKRSTEHQPLGWDDPLPQDLKDEWQRWRNSLHDLERLFVTRCYHPKEFGEITKVELHAFSDASQDAIGATIYLRLINNEGEASVSLLFAQTKLTPKRITTIPRLELCGGVLSTRAITWISKELRIHVDEIVFYTDSKVVLGYIQNESRRFYTYVANRVQIIRQASDPTQWKYIETADNPADLTTRSITPKQLIDSQWLKGPEFLSNVSHQATPNRKEFPIREKDPELRPLITHTKLQVSGSEVKGLNSVRFNRFSEWRSLRRAIANLIAKLREIKSRRNSSGKENSINPIRQGSSQPKRITLSRAPSAVELKCAEAIMIKTVQAESFALEIEILSTSLQAHADLSTNSNAKLNKSRLCRLDPFLDDNGVLRVGGRLRRSNEDYVEKHPAILPRGHHLSNLAITYHHEKVHHQGRLITHGAVRQAGIWVMGASRMVSKAISRCIKCKRLRGKLSTQHMADLPSDRMGTPPPFTNVGFDVFGPWTIKTRKLRGGAVNFKRWGLVFTCLNSRAIHIEVLEMMDSSSFICALRRFFSIRGPAAKLRCDRGTNFIGGKTELDNALREMDHRAIKRYVTEEGCEWLFNPPHASHFGGVWERQIGTIRRILDSMLLKVGPQQLTHELLVTLMAEVSAIVNARPIASLPTCTDHPQPLSPAMLLTMKTRPLLSPPGVFVSQDLYSRRYWRRAQYLADQFWIRWKQEYLQALQSRSKWNDHPPNLEVGDIVIVKDQTPRNQWPLGKIVDAIKSKDDKVRKAEVALWKDGGIKKYLRPVNELILLIRSKTQ